MNENLVNAIRLDLVELIDRTEELLTVVNNVEDSLKRDVKAAEPLQWLDFTIVLDRLAVSMTMLHDRLNSMRDSE